MMRPAQPTGPLGRLVALAAGAILLILGFMFSLVVLAVVAIAGLGVWAYVWWKTRALRKAMREQQPPAGDVIDGEAIVVEDYEVTERRVLPGDKG